MLRRRKNKSAALTTVLPPLVIGWIFLLLIRDRDWNGIAFVSGFTAVIIFVMKVGVPSLKRKRLLEQVDAITDAHLDALIRQRTIQVRTDPYGKPVMDKWHAEIDYFITHHVRPGLSRARSRLMDKQRRAVADRIAERVAAAAQQRPAFQVPPVNMSGAEFETFCAERLRACGWDVRVTPLSRDQGVDVVAEKNGTRVALQCKLYSNPVGNKAVQEVAAGRIHQQAHYGAVVTNGTFTAAAKELAATNGIRLLHHSDLPQLEQILSQPVAY